MSIGENRVNVHRRKSYIEPRRTSWHKGGCSTRVHQTDNVTASVFMILASCGSVETRRSQEYETEGGERQGTIDEGRDHGICGQQQFEEERHGHFLTDRRGTVKHPAISRVVTHGRE